MTTSMSAGARTASPATRRRRSTRALAVLGATAVAAVLWLLAVPVAGIDLAVRTADQTQSVGLTSVLGVSLVAGLVGWALLAALESRIRRAAAIWTAVALTVAVLSLAGPLASAASFPAAGVLTGMHLLVAAVLVPALRRTSVSR